MFQLCLVTAYAPRNDQKGGHESLIMGTSTFYLQDLANMLKLLTVQASYYHIPIDAIACYRYDKIVARKVNVRLGGKK